MDLDDFWQENKRWVLSCVAGLLVFLIGNAIIGSTYNTATRTRTAALGEKYNAADLQKVQAEKKDLDAKLTALHAAMNYVAPERFIRNGDPATFWTDTYSKLRKELFSSAYEANVEFPEVSLSWQTADDAAGIDRGLIGLSLVEHLVQQLLAAHKTVTEKDLEAGGVRSIGIFTPDRHREDRRRARREGEPRQADEFLSEIKVGFKFEADNATVHRFIENCRDASRRITLGSIKITRGRVSGDPLSVTGEIIALTIKPIPKDI